MPLLRVDKVGELERIPDEENGGVVADEIPVALLRVEFQRKAAHIALGIGRAPLAGHGGKTQERVGLLAHLREDRRLVNLVMSCVTVKVPYAPEPLACTVRSGMRSRF